MPSSSLHHELNALRAELGKPSAAAAQSPQGAAADEIDETLARAMDEQLSALTKALSDYTGNMEDFIAEHPLASMLAAFALGVAVGRMTGRT